MEIGDKVFVMKSDGNYWEGNIVDIKDKYNKKITYNKPIAIIKEIHGSGYSTCNED